MKYNIILNKNKNIGKVVFIVEGDKKEHSLLGHIFKEILNYTLVDIKRYKPPYLKYTSRQNADSKVFVVSAQSSNIKYAGKTGQDYLDHVFAFLYEEYELDISNAAVYYIFDRDSESNLYSETEKLAKILKNSRDNGIDANGLLLLSYPCIEAYIKQCVDNYLQGETVESPKSLKAITSKPEYQYSKIDVAGIITACNNMLLGIRDIYGRKLTAIDLDDFEGINAKILSSENNTYLNHKQYILLSLLSVAFLDLGILEITSPS